MTNLKLILFISLWLCCSLLATAQESVSGVVYEIIEGKRSALPGVNIYWKGSQMGTVSDADGLYQLELHPEICCLVFSHVSGESDTVHGFDEKKHYNYNHIMLTSLHLSEVEIAARRKASYVSSMNPLHVEHLTGEGLRRAACCNLAESFETNASVDVSYSDAVTGAKQIELLGLSGLYSQMMAENMPNFRGLAATFGLNYVPGTWMNAIQISKGTSSVRNGYESISGQINVDYKKPEAGESEKLFLNLYGNSATMTEINFNMRWRVGQGGSMILLGHANRNFMKMDDNGDTFMDDPMVNQGNLFYRFNYAKDRFEGMWGLKVLNEKRRGGQIDEKLPEGFMPYHISLNTRRYEIFSKTGILFNRDNTSLGLQQQIIYHNHCSYYTFHRRYSARQSSYYANLLFDSYIVNDHHRYSLGLSYSYDLYKERYGERDYGLLMPQYAFDSSSARIEHVPGSFAEYVFSDESHWSVIMGMRVDYNSYYRKMLYTPRLHVRFNTHEELTLRFSAGKGYRSPNVLAENSALMSSARAIRFLETPKMEEAWNYGINLAKGFDIGWRELTLQADVYRTDFVNQIVLDRDADVHEVRIYNLNGKSYSTSAQIEANCELFRNFDLTLAFRYNDVKMTIGDSLREKPFVNRYKGLLSISYAFSSWQFDLTAQLNGDSRVPSLEGNATAVAAGQNMDRSPAYVIVNAQVTKKLGKQWELYAGGENLTNYRQKHPIIAADHPSKRDFDASMVWGPLSGVRGYVGLRFAIE